MRSLAVRTSLALAIALLSGPASGGPLVLSPVGDVPAEAPCGLTVAESRAAAFAMVGDHEGDAVRSLRIDRTSGLLTLVGSVTLPNGPSALAVAPGGRFVLGTTLRGNDVTSYSIDRTSGLLTLVGSTTSGGQRPVNLAVGKGGFAIIANADSDNVGVVKIDRTSGLLTLVGSVTVGDAPSDVKVSGRKVIVATSTDVHYLALSKSGSLEPMDVESVGASPVTSVDVRGSWVAAGTFGGEVHTFRIRRGNLTPLGANPTGGDITDVAFSPDGTLFVTGGFPPRLSAFDLEPFAQVGTVAFGPALTSRTLAITRGNKRTDWVMVNEFQSDRTVVVSATSERRGR